MPKTNNNPHIKKRNLSEFLTLPLLTTELFPQKHLRFENWTNIISLINLQAREQSGLYFNNGNGTSSYHRTCAGCHSQRIIK